MYKRAFIGISIVVVAAVIGVAAYVLRPSAQPSSPLTAIPVEIEATSQPTPQAQTAADPSGEAGESAPTDQAGGAVVFTIMPQESQVRFILDELLRGAPTTVVGATNQVTGEIAVDFAQPGSAKVGTILINARSLATDNDFRNRAINNEILETGAYEFITFAPTQISGFPENPVLGQAFDFQITGDLTIRDVTRQVTFDVQASAQSETRITGSATATVARADYKLEIPSVPGVADVDEEVRLEIDFVAER